MIRDAKPAWAKARLQHNLEWTCGGVYENGKPVYNGYIYLASIWAVPLLIMDGEEYERYRRKHEVPN